MAKDKRGGWNKGLPAWNRGTKWPEEVKQHISEGMKRNHPMHGKHCKHWSLEIRERQSKSHRRSLELRKKQMLLLLMLLDNDGSNRLKNLI